MASDRKSPAPPREEPQVPSRASLVAVIPAPGAHIPAGPGADSPPSIASAAGFALPTSSSARTPDLVNFPGSLAAQLGENATPQQRFTALEPRYRQWLVETVKLRIREDNDYDIDAAILEVTVESKHKLSPLSEDDRKLMIEYIVEYLIPEQAKTRPPSPPKKPKKGKGKGKVRAIGQAAKPPGATSTSTSGEDVPHEDDKEIEDESGRYRAAIRISGYLNDITVRDDIPVSRLEDFIDIRPFTPNEVIKVLSQTIWEFEEERVREYVRRPFRTQVAKREKQKRTDDEPEPARHEQPKKTSHPTNQKLRDYETYMQNKDGKWCVAFRRDIQLPDGRRRVYEQIDRLPIYNEDAPAMNLPETEKDTYIPDHSGLILPGNRTDGGTWQRIDAGTTSGDVYRRVYPDGTSKAIKTDERKLSRTAHPTFILRSFHRQTHGYVKQFHMGRSWKEFDKLVMGFDMNNPECVEEYNRWVRPIQDDYDYRYYKRPVRELYTKSEMVAMRNHFRELFSNSGLIDAYKRPQWKELVRKINEAAVADGNNVVRMRDGVSTKIEREIYANDVPYLGIQEWRECGKRLYNLQKEIAELQIPEHVLKPKNPIPANDVQDTKNEEEGTEPESKELSSWKRRDTRIPKLDFSIVEGKLVISDRFDGVLVKRHGLMDHASEVGQSHLVASEVVQDDGALKTSETGQDQAMPDAGQVPSEASMTHMAGISEPVGDSRRMKQSPGFGKDNTAPENDDDQEAWEDIEAGEAVDDVGLSRKKRRLHLP